MSTGQTVANPAPPSFQNAHEAIRDAEQELDQLLRQRVALMRRIGTVKQTLVCLAYAPGDEALTPEVLRLLGRGTTRKQPGFTRACRIVLMEAGIPLDARRGLQELRLKFPHLVEHLKAPIASVTTVFNRLVGYGEYARSPTVGVARYGSGSPSPATARKQSLLLGGRPTGDSFQTTAREKSTEYCSGETV